MLVDRILRQRYKIIERIGGGGFGDTYKAIDLDFPNQRHCVVKHLCPKDSAPEAIAIAKRLFHTEAKCLSRLGENDRIPRLYSYFEEDGEFYLVQEFIEGKDLTQEFQPGKKWSETETVKFLQELLEILSIVHQENTIHRDIKPANIMRRQSDRKLVLIDFGAVKEILTVNQKGQTDITVGIGSGFYTAPEQAMGRPGKYSDVYSVGMLGIQALTGLTFQELPKDSDKLQKMWQDLQIEVSPQFKYVLNNMVSFQYKERYSDAAEALKAFISTGIDRKERVINSPETTVIVSQPKRKLLFILLAAIGLTGTGIYALPFLNQPNYTQLETYLNNKRWQQADTETDRIILKVAGEKSSLDGESINKFPCKTLQKIDELWTENSDGRFGFTPQKKAYLETGNQFGQYIESAYEEFANKVKWRTFGAWSLYGDLKFTDLATPGHLPSPGRVASDNNDLRFFERGMLLSRFDACGLE
jgi:serine/threonine-protein kinase